ncbi:MAG: hypothetical protein COW16_10400 [Sphingomonadales bacterium CG12_big_fil_rev_8_21_14_0_65_65_10]|nr:MAG: hypothetical protein COW16_10400 [Sphingomonadales bacterium CG12_big_fil_rev_8_21_14_0_65_65_10]
MIAAIEKAIIDALQTASDDGRLSYAWRTLETYPDDWEEYLRENRNLRTPGAWAVFLGAPEGDDRDGQDTGWEARLRFALVVAAQNQRNEENSRHGDGAKPGSYQLAIDAVRILSRNDLAPLELSRPIAVRSIRTVSRSVAMRKQSLSLIALELECGVPFGVLGEAAGDFTGLHVDWDVPAFGNVAGPADPLPSDTPDAEDLIEVPQ